MRTKMYCLKLLATFSVIVTATFSALLPSASAYALGKGPYTVKFAKRHTNVAQKAVKHKDNTVNTIPFWASAFTYNGTSYPFQMVGTDPSAGSATTTVPTEIIPLNLVFADGNSLDGTKNVSALQASPLFQDADFTSGTTQYGDAIQRAEFWQYVSTSSSDYHVLLGNLTVHDTVTLNVPIGSGIDGIDPNTGKPAGLVDINWFDIQIQGLIGSLQISPTSLPIFIDYNVFLYDTTPDSCCIGGYHSAFEYTDNNGQTNIQTYAFAAYPDANLLGIPFADTDALSHELAEWYNDPFILNIVPTWSVPGAPQYGCSQYLEVGDPLVGTDFQVNGYDLQDEAFYSWFTKDTTSIGINGQYSYLGTLTEPSPTC